MKTQINMNDFVLKIDDYTAIVPALTFVLCLGDIENREGIQQFHDRGLEALGSLLTHYRAQEMTRRSKISDKAKNFLKNWIAKPPHQYPDYLEYYGCDSSAGVTAAGLSFHLVLRVFKGRPAADREKWLASWQKRSEQGENVKAALRCSVLRISVPLVHSLADPQKFYEWILDLDLVKSGQFSSGYAGLALNFDRDSTPDHVRQKVEEQLAALALRHPGFDWQNYWHMGESLLPFDPKMNDFFPLIKRVNWLSLISAKAIERLSGLPTLEKRLKEYSEIKTEKVGTALVIKAGASPQVGDLAANDSVPVYRHVGKVLLPVRMEKISGLGTGFESERTQEWLEMFDGNKHN